MYGLFPFGNQEGVRILWVLLARKYLCTIPWRHYRFDDTLVERYAHTVAILEQITRAGYKVEFQWELSSMMES